MDNVGTVIDGSLSKYGLLKGIVIVCVVMCAMTYWLRDFFKAFLGVLWSGRPTQTSENNSSKKSEPQTQQPSVVNVYLSLDPKATGDYVQQVKLDEEKSRGAICMGSTSPPESPRKKEDIENVADGFDLIDKSDAEPEECKTQLETTAEEVKKTK